MPDGPILLVESGRDGAFPRRVGPGVVATAVGLYHSATVPLRDTLQPPSCTSLWWKEHTSTRLS